jgi:hypothetical protein
MASSGLPHHVELRVPDTDHRAAYVEDEDGFELELVARGLPRTVGE